VQKLVSRLVAAGLLRSTRGVGGGLKLAGPAGGRSAWPRIIEAVEGPIALTACVESGRHDCALEQGCGVRRIGRS
jgi:DNA-binding IscR family transcriptional regulator